jgi:hypothetical protein
MKKIIFILCLCLSYMAEAQQQNRSSSFWDEVRWGGTAGANFSNRFTNVSIAPQAIYPVSPYFSTGLGLQYSYFERKNVFSSHLYGGSLLNFFHPVPYLQVSAELEQLRVNNRFDNGIRDEFWNTALFFGLGYRQNNIIIGIRYNVLFDADKNVYPEAWLPFIRVFF